MTVAHSTVISTASAPSIKFHGGENRINLTDSGKNAHESVRKVGKFHPTVLSLNLQDFYESASVSITISTSSAGKTERHLR